LDSWSKYTSFIPLNLIEDARKVLFKGNEVHQMMLVVGEEGTSLDDFEIYMKSEFLDAVYLQQNSFDQVDGASNPERQKYVFNKVHEVLMIKFNLADKNDARAYFNKLRQAFIDWNYLDFKEDKFKQQEQMINKMIKEKARDAKSL
jgi:V/A-type H+-transporting ATPase subunit A